MQKAWSMAKDTVMAWLDDRAPSMGAALAYYTLFSIAPLLVIAIAVAGFFFGEEAASGELFGRTRELVGDQAATAVQGLVESARRPGEGTVAFIIGLVTILIGATAVFGELQSALDRIWEVPPERQESGLWSAIRARLLSFAMVLGVALLLLFSVAASAVIPVLGRLFEPALGTWVPVMQIANLLVALVVFTAAFALIYKFVPRADIAWRDVWIGASVTSVLIVLGKILIGLYIGKSGITSGFGAAGAIVALMVWVYYSAQVFLLGAEFTWVYAKRRGGSPVLRQARDDDVVRNLSKLDDRRLREGRPLGPVLTPDPETRAVASLAVLAVAVALALRR